MNNTDFEHIVTRLRPRLVSMAEQMARNSHMMEADVEDAVQDTLVKLWRMGDKIDGYRSVDALAVTMLRNVCIDMSRRKTLPTESLDGVQAVADNSADDSLTAKTMRNEMDRMISQLPTTQQRLIRLRGDGMSLDDISTITEMPKTSVKTLIARARRKLWCWVAAVCVIGVVVFAAMAKFTADDKSADKPLLASHDAIDNGTVIPENDDSSKANVNMENSVVAANDNAITSETNESAGRHKYRTVSKTYARHKSTPHEAKASSVDVAHVYEMAQATFQDASCLTIERKGDAILLVMTDMEGDSQRYVVNDDGDGQLTFMRL